MFAATAEHGLGYQLCTGARHADGGCNVSSIGIVSSEMEIAVTCLACDESCSCYEKHMSCNGARSNMWGIQ